MPFYEKAKYGLVGYDKSRRKHKMYDAILIRKKDNKIVRVPFGDKRYENYRDATGLNLYPHLIHGDKKRRTAYRARHKGYLKQGYYSPGYFSMYYLW